MATTKTARYSVTLTRTVRETVIVEVEAGFDPATPTNNERRIRAAALAKAREMDSDDWNDPTPGPARVVRWRLIP